jgi:thiol:disulfide interchange protein DsbD
MGAGRQIIAAVLVSVAGGLAAEREAAVTAQLVVEVTAVAPGQAFRAGVLFRIAKGWHLYWLNPGESGLPPQLLWQLPPGWTLQELPWPAPRRFADADLVSYGHADELLLSVRLIAPRVPAGAESAELRAEVSWLACERVCVPGRATLSKPLRPAASSGLPDADAVALFERFEARWPRPLANWDATAWRHGDGITVRFRPVARGAEADAARTCFFPAEPGLVASLPTLAGSGPGSMLDVHIATLADRHRALRQIEGILFLATPAGQPDGVPMSVSVPVSDQATVPQPEALRTKENAP